MCWREVKQVCRSADAALIIHSPFPTIGVTDASTTDDVLTKVEFPFPEHLVLTTRGVESDGVMAFPTAGGVFGTSLPCDVFDNSGVRSL